MNAFRVGDWWWVGWGAGAVVVLALLAAWQGGAYVLYSDGVYTESARLVLRGLVPYRDFAAAQPPGVYGFGAAILALGDSVSGLRHGLAAVDFSLALLTLAIVLRLTGRRLAAAAAGLAVLISPWSLYGHAQLVPETFGAPLLLGAVLAASRRRSAWLAGVLGSAAVLFKLPFLLPALAISVASAAPVAALAWMAGSLAAGLLACTLVFGEGFWRGAVEAQWQTGSVAPHYLAGLIAQGLWNLLPLAMVATLAIVHRVRTPDQVLFRVVLAAAISSLGLAGSLFKSGSYLNVLSIAEPPLIILGAAGLTWMLGAPLRRVGRHVIAAVGFCVAVTVAQSLSLLLAPTHPTLFTRPFAKTTAGWALSSAQLALKLAVVRKCPPRLAFSGRPYIAFAAGRRMPGNQPDVFIIQNARINRRFLALARRDGPVCPARKAQPRRG